MLDACGRASKRVARSTLLVAGLALGAMTGGVDAANAQGLFEALFGRRLLQETPPVVVISPGRWHDPARRQQVRQRKGSGDRPKVAVKPTPYVAPEVMPGPLGRFLKDPTLRRGDVVATADGLMVFRGNGGATHRAKDFVPVGKAAQLLPKKVRTDLAQMDQVVRSGEVVAPDTAQVASASPPIVAQDEKVTVR